VKPYAQSAFDCREQRATKDQQFEMNVEKILQTDGKVSNSSTTVQIVDFPTIKLENIDKRAVP